MPLFISSEGKRPYQGRTFEVLAIETNHKPHFLTQLPEKEREVSPRKASGKRSEKKSERLVIPLIFSSLFDDFLKGGGQ